MNFVLKKFTYRSKLKTQCHHVYKDMFSLLKIMFGEFQNCLKMEDVGICILVTNIIVSNEKGKLLSVSPLVEPRTVCVGCWS